VTDRLLSFHDLLRWLAYGAPSEDAEHIWQEAQRGKLSSADWNDAVIRKHQETVDAILREGRAGKLTILARHGEHATKHEPIPHTDLINARIDELWRDGDAAVFLQTENLLIGTDPLWVQLRFDRVNVLEVWPHLATNQQPATAGESAADKKAPTTLPPQKRKGGPPPGAYYGPLKTFLKWYEKNVPGGFGNRLNTIAAAARARLTADGEKDIPRRSALEAAIRKAQREIAAGK
jgi:hypothetical protein